MLKLKACNDWIIVDRKANSKEFKSGSISIIEDRVQYEGTVLSVGKDVDISVNPGDTVIWGKWEGTPLMIGGRQVTAIRCSDAILIGVNS